MYAWWCLAEHDTTAQGQLASLCCPDLEGVSDDYRTFACRARQSHNWRLAFPKMSPVKDVDIKRVNFRKGGWCYFMLDAGDLVETHCVRLARQPAQSDLQRALLDCVSEDSRCPADVMNESLCNARFFVAQDCLDALIHITRQLPDPLPLLNQLPRNWQSLYVVRHLVAAGRKEPALLSFARQACDEHANIVFCQAAHERDLCRNKLECCGETKENVLNDAAGPPRSPFQRLFGGDVESLRFAGQIDSRPSGLLETLNGVTRDPFDLPTLYEWRRSARSWQGLLFAQLFRRMFIGRSLHHFEVAQLIEHVLAVVKSLPTSALRTEYETVYGTIRQAVGGRKTKCDRTSRPQ